MKTSQTPTSPEAGSAKGQSRRQFIQGSGIMLAGGAIGGPSLSVARGAHAYGSDLIRVGLIGCGRRGTAAAVQALNTPGGDVRLSAMGDAFEHNLQTAFRSIKGQHPRKVDVGDARFVGLESFRRVLESDVDVVLLTTPPGFRPLHFEAAISAGKHVFMEKPVATDAPGVRRVLAANRLAKEKGLAVQVGLQRHHEIRYRECIEQLRAGAIGEPVYARVYWNGRGDWIRPRKQGQSELEYQLRNWYYFNWLSGDQISEQHIHNIDVINWVLGGYPRECQGQGGRQVRTGPDHGETFDHHMVEYTYENNVKLFSQCRHMQGCWNSVGEHVHGTDGHCDIAKAVIYDRTGTVRWQSKAKETKGKGWQQEHNDLFTSLRQGLVPNEGDNAAYSTLTAIMGRMATYGGKVVKWEDALQSSLQLADIDRLSSLDDEPPLAPDENGHYPIAVPGETRVL